jgi:hypothetical protein
LLRHEHQLLRPLEEAASGISTSSIALSTGKAQPSNQAVTPAELVNA